MLEQITEFQLHGGYIFDDSVPAGWLYPYHEQQVPGHQESRRFVTERGTAAAPTCKQALR